MKIFFTAFLLMAFHSFTVAQTKDTLIISGRNNSDSVSIRAKKPDTLAKQKNIPRNAALRSAIIPGWGQVYNKKYWKVPLVYAAVGIPVYLFLDNKKWYNRSRYALSIISNDRYGNADSLAQVDPLFKPFVDAKLSGSLITYRNQVRRNMDYSILFILLMWGLNVIDATVDAHLRGFDISDDLSLKIKPSYLPGTCAAGISLVLNFK